MTTPSTNPNLVGEEISLRSATEADVQILLRLFAEPAVERWWFPHDEARVRERITRDSQFGWVIEHRGEATGWIQAGEEDDQEYRSAWIDIAVATAEHGTGVALDALRTVMRFLTDQRGHHRITIDPDVDNERAVRAYEKVGFRRVGVMRHYSRRPDGSLGDGLLMEHVAGLDDHESESTN